MVLMSKAIDRREILPTPGLIAHVIHGDSSGRQQYDLAAVHDGFRQQDFGRNCNRNSESNALRREKLPAVIEEWMSKRDSHRTGLKI
jgi:hypothetical protein